MRLLLTFALSFTLGCTDAYLDRAAHEPGASYDSTGSVFRSLRAGDGMTPHAADLVRVQYRAESAEGGLIADSSTSGGPLAFKLETAIPCWQKALERMHAGEKARVVCPYYATYRENGNPPKIPRNVTVAFDLELVAVEPVGSAPPIPGLAIKVLHATKGAQPADTDHVKVHYEGRLDDGSVFDSSVKRGTPIVLPLDGVIQCWHLLIPKMHVGEKAELTCPPESAYGAKGTPGIPPNSRLTFEVELIDIEPPAPPAQ